MEVAVLFKVGDVIIKILASPIFKEIRSIWKYEKEIEMLAKTVDLIEKVLYDVENMQFQGKSVIEDYKQLRLAFLDAEDFLDRVETLKKKHELKTRSPNSDIYSSTPSASETTCATGKITDKADGKGKFLASAHIKLKSISNETRRFFSSSNQVKYAIDVHTAIKKIRNDLEAVLQHLHKFALKEPSIRSEATHTTARASGSYVDATEIIGRDEDKRKIVGLLRSAFDEKKIPVISIVGIGGMGKTTVAQFIYNDQSWQGSCSFEPKVWVSGSKKLNLKSLLRKILKSITPSDPNLNEMGEDQLKNQFVEYIVEKKFLLVLDDMENEDPWNWRNSEALLNNGNKDSRILVTTRSREVAKVVGSSNSTYELEGLSKKDSLELFKTYAFGEKRDENLSQICELIAEKCVGVPLALKVIGALLCGKDRGKWERVRDNGYAGMRSDGNQLMPILKISYDHLDPTLKQCFLYCSLFPKDHHISKAVLSNIWMDNVHFKVNEGETLQDICDETFNILYNRGFLEVAKRNHWEDDTCFKLHDLMHDLAKQVAGEESLVAGIDTKVDSDKLIIKENVRHLSLLSHSMRNIGTSEFHFKGKRLRTFLGYHYFSREHAPFSVDQSVSDCPVLRFLELSDCTTGKLDSIGKLIHLRYLDLSWNKFETLPDSVTELINLRHLKLAGCIILTHLPLEMGSLISLEALNISYCYRLSELPKSMEKLVSLKHLNLSCCPMLSISHSIIGALTSLEVLDISDCNTSRELQIGAENLINLRQLKLANNMALNYLDFEIGSLTSLEVLDMSYCVNLRLLPRSTGKLVNLKHFNLEGCRSLTQMPPEMGALMTICRPPRFIVGHPESEDTAQLEELVSVSELSQGELIIELPYYLPLKSSGDGESYLLNKKQLRKLEIKWKKEYDLEKFPTQWKKEHNLEKLPMKELRDVVEAEVPSNHVDVLAKLQPPRNLEEFRLEKYQGMTFPALMDIDDFASLMPNLEKLCIFDCGNLRHLPPISRLPCLKYLELSNCTSLEYIEENVTAPSFYLSLKKLTLWSLPKLERWCRDICRVDQEQSLTLPSFPRLLDLDIYECPSMMLESILDSFSIHVENPQRDERGGGVHLILEELESHQDSLDVTQLNLESPSASGYQLLPRKMMNILSSLSGLRDPFSFSSPAQSLAREMTKHLVHLDINYYPGLTNIQGLQYLTTLRELEIRSCIDYTGEEDEVKCSQADPWKQLQSLRRLTLVNLPKMARLPDGIQFLTSFQLLTIRDCVNLKYPEWVDTTFVRNPLGGLYRHYRKKL